MHKSLTHNRLLATLVVLILAACRQTTVTLAPLDKDNEVFLHQAIILQDGLCASVDYDNGYLMFLSNTPNGYNYAGGRPLWRMYYNTPERKEIELTGADEVPEVSMVKDTIHLDYESVGGKAFKLHLRIWGEDGQLHFGATVENQEPHTIIRELQYPLIGHLQLPEGYQLLTTHTGGQLFDDPIATVANVSPRALYMTPAQKFRQYDLQYPRNAAANCFAFVGAEDGLYFGSHDPSLQQTWHGLRAYPDDTGHLCAGGDEGRADGQIGFSSTASKNNLTGGVEQQMSGQADTGHLSARGDERRASGQIGFSGTASKNNLTGGVGQKMSCTAPIGHVTEDFKHLEAGFYRYPNAMCGDTWRNDASVIVPYKGDWTATSRLYRHWADTWWKHAPVPQWVQDMTGWQRVIFKHQYGEYLRTYADLPGRIAAAGESVGCHAVLAFGWWKEGMDNGYPNYSLDDTQGGEQGWKDAILAYRAGRDVPVSPANLADSIQNRLLLYFNGRLIDVESDFYRSGGGAKVANKDNTGREFTEHYKFTGEGTTLGYYDSRTFVIADMSQRLWRDQLLNWADRAMAYGADAVFYDQLGVAEEFPNWDLSREYPVQDIFTGRYKAEALKEIRDHIKARNPEFALGTEWLSDCTSQFCDCVHIVEFTALPESFPEWFRYTFPEVVWSDRCVRDDNDVPRRVNNTLLKGLRNDIEVFRCRGLIDETPVYQAHLAKINGLRHAWPELLLEGRYTATDGFTCSNPALTARSYTSGNRMAIVVTNTGEKTQKGKIAVPGYRFVEGKNLEGGQLSSSSVKLGQYELNVLIYEK